MTTGMKKFTKGCLITALVIFIVGAVLCGVGGLLGGFRILDGMDIREVTGIPLVYRFGPNGRFEYGFFWDDDDIDWGRHENWERVSGIEDETALELTADTLRDLYIGVGGCKLYIEESEDEYVRLAIDGNANRLRYHVENDSLQLVRESGWKWNWVRINWDEWNASDKIYLYLPKGTSLDYADIEVGAGYIESVGLTAHDANIEVGVGEINIDSLTVDNEAVLSVGAGRIKVEELYCDMAEMDIGAGELEIDNAMILKEADIDLGMGSVNIGGVIMGDLDVDCGMGTVMLDMGDAEQDHNFKIDCAMGTVEVGSQSYSGLGSERTIDNGVSSDYDIDCSMGTVTVTFEK